jgi:hypothetical protein
MIFTKINVHNALMVLSFIFKEKDVIWNYNIVKNIIFNQNFFNVWNAKMDMFYKMEAVYKENRTVLYTLNLCNVCYVQSVSFSIVPINVFPKIKILINFFANK